MAISDITGWDWILKQGTLRIYPTAWAYGKYLAILLILPCPLFLILWTTRITPWHLLTSHTLADQALHGGQAQNDGRVQRDEQAKQIQQELIESLRSTLGNENADDLLKQAEEKSKQRVAQGRVQRKQGSIVRRTCAMVIGVVWLVLLGWVLQILA
jgi:hypothetical protein